MSAYLHSERHFRRYENYIERIVNTYPQCVTFTPQPPVASVETLSSRIRICIKALFHAQKDGKDWPVKFSMAKFLQVMDDIVVSTTAEAGKVVCGPSELVRRRVPLGVQVEPESEQSIPLINLIPPRSNDPDLIRAIGLLHHHQILVEPSRVETDQWDVAQMLMHLDVAVERVGNLYTIL